MFSGSAASIVGEQINYEWLCHETKHLQFQTPIKKLIMAS